MAEYVRRSVQFAQFLLESQNLESKLATLYVALSTTPDQSLMHHLQQLKVAGDWAIGPLTRKMRNDFPEVDVACLNEVAKRRKWVVHHSMLEPSALADAFCPFPDIAAEVTMMREANVRLMQQLASLPRFRGWKPRLRYPEDTDLVIKFTELLKAVSKPPKTGSTAQQ